jgi:hypothetical protein
MQIKHCIILLSLFAFVVANAQQSDSLDLYLLIGQSNMAGRGEVKDKYAEEQYPNVLMLTKEKQWVIAKHPLHFDKSVAGVGPGLSFGKEMTAISKGRKVGLIPCAVGGTSIDVWQPGGFDKSTNTHPYDDAIDRLNTALRSGKLKGVIWLQGEADSGAEKAASYLSKLTVLISRVRSIVNNPQLPFVAGELGQFKEQYQNINKELAKLPATVPETAVASSKGFIDKGDQTHFDAESMEQYGIRFAEKMKLLLAK